MKEFKDYNLKVPGMKAYLASTVHRGTRYNLVVFRPEHEENPYVSLHEFLAAYPEMKESPIIPVRARS